MATFCVTSMAQEVCRPPLVSFGVHREELKDGWLHTTGGFINETRMIELDYLDNRRIDQFEFISQGWVDMSSISENNRRIKYRQKVPINFGDYVIHQDTLDYEVCASSGHVIFYCEQSVVSGETERIEWSYTIEITPFGDLNGDECVNGADIGLFLNFMYLQDMSGDFDLDGEVGSSDLGILLANWKTNDCIEPPEDPEDGPYNPVWESADDILAFTIDSWENGLILTENVTVEDLKGGMIGIVDDTGNGGTKFFHLFSNFQVLGVSGWSPLDTWVVEVYDDEILVGRTSSDSSGPVYNPDGSSNYGNSIYWNPMIEPFKIGDRWILYRWIDTPDIPEYPPSRLN